MQGMVMLVTRGAEAAGCQPAGNQPHAGNGAGNGAATVGSNVGERLQVANLQRISHMQGMVLGRGPPQLEVLLVTRGAEAAGCQPAGNQPHAENGAGKGAATVGSNVGDAWG